MLRRASLPVAALALASCVASPPPAPEAPQAIAREARAAYTVVPGTIGALGETATSGVRVATVAPGGTAAEAGLRAGDIVMQCQGRAVHTVRDFNHCVLSSPPGRQLHLDLVRDGSPIGVDIPVRQLRTAWRV